MIRTLHSKNLIDKLKAFCVPNNFVLWCSPCAQLINYPSDIPIITAMKRSLKARNYPSIENKYRNIKIDMAVRTFSV